MHEFSDPSARDVQRLLALSGGVLDESIDDQLQEVVHQAAGELGAPIALVSLVLDRLQYFKAHVGLPEEVAAVRAADREVSFCQFVVRDGEPFVVEDAAADERVPKDMVERLGVRAYLGVPVRARGAVVGSLCVIDMEQRGFSNAQQQRLCALAEVASHRLTELFGARRGQMMLSRATAPAFAELRNLLSPLRTLTASTRISAFELGVMARAAETIPPDPDTQHKTRSTLEDLSEGLDMLEQLAVRIQDQVLAIENIAKAQSSSVTLAEVVHDGLRLAHHHTKLVGGVQTPAIPEPMTLATARSVAVANLAMALSAVATAMRPSQEGLSISLVEDEFTVVLSIETPLAPERLAEVGRDLELLSVDPSSAVRVDALGLHLGFTRANLPDGSQHP